MDSRLVRIGTVRMLGGGLYSLTITRTGSQASEASPLSFFFNNIGLRSPDQFGQHDVSVDGNVWHWFPGYTRWCTERAVPARGFVYGEANDSHSRSLPLPPTLHRLLHGLLRTNNHIAGGFGRYGGYERGGLEGRGEVGGN